MVKHLTLMMIVLVAVTAVDAADPGVHDKHPVYVGSKVCTQCHRGPIAGHQFSLWRMSKHAEAYATLWSPDSKRIAELTTEVALSISWTTPTPRRASQITEIKLGGLRLSTRAAPVTLRPPSLV